MINKKLYFYPMFFVGLFACFCAWIAFDLTITHLQVMNVDNIPGKVNGYRVANGMFWFISAILVLLGIGDYFDIFGDSK